MLSVYTCMNRDNFTEKLVMIGLYMLKYASIFMFKIAATVIFEICKLKDATIFIQCYHEEM